MKATYLVFENRCRSGAKNVDKTKSPKWVLFHFKKQGGRPLSDSLSGATAMESIPSPWGERKGAFGRAVVILLGEPKQFVSKSG